MKRILIILLAFFIGGSTAEAKGWKIFAPKEGTPQTDISISGKKKTYYVLSKGQSISLEVKGPKELRILSRLADGYAQDKESNYTLQLQRSKADVVEEVFSSHLAKEAHVSESKSAKVGVSRNWKTDVPTGTQIYTLTVKEDVKVYVRFFTQAKKTSKKVSRVSITPNQYADAVPLHYQEKELTYYRVNGKKSAKLEVYGKTTLKVLSRLEFDPAMKGDKTYRIQVTEDGNVVKTVQINATKSEVTKYADKTDKVPAKGESFYVKVPEGKHTYEFRVLESDFSALLRFFIPKSDVEKGAK